MEKSASIGQIWESSKAYLASNTVKRYDAIIDASSVDQLGSYLMKHPISTMGISQETKADERLQRYNIMKITPTKRLGEIENLGETYIITDEKGHDIGTYCVDDNGHVLSFKLSEKILSSNEKIINQFPEESREAIREMYKIETLDDLTHKLAKGETIAIQCKEQVQDDLVKHKAEAINADISIEKSQDEDEKDAIDALPADMREEVLSQCRERGIKIKEVLIVDCPKCLGEEMTEGSEELRDDGGPVIMVQAKSGDASQLSDDLYMFQDGREIQNIEQDRDRMLALMEQHKGEGAVPELEDTREDSIRAKIESQVVLAEARKEQYPEDTEQINKDLELAIDSIVDYYGGSPSKNLQEDINEIQEKNEEENQEVEENTMDDEDDLDDHEMNRWESANPFNHD